MNDTNHRPRNSNKDEIDQTYAERCEWIGCRGNPVCDDEIRSYDGPGQDCCAQADREIHEQPGGYEGVFAFRHFVYYTNKATFDERVGSASNFSTFCVASKLALDVLR